MIQIFHIGELKKGDIFSAELIYKNPPDEDDLAHFQIALFGLSESAASGNDLAA